MATDTVIYRDRIEAGLRLAEAFKVGKPSVMKPDIVLSLPRGGAIVGGMIARTLQIPHDVIVCRKIGAPYNPEVAVAAVTQDGDLIKDSLAFEALSISTDYLDNQCLEQIREIKRRLTELRGNKPFPQLSGQRVIVVDDGVATGLTIQAALVTIRAKEPQEIILAVPVGPVREIQKLSVLVDRVVCPAIVDTFESVGQFYWDFHQVTDEEVRQALR